MASLCSVLCCILTVDSGFEIVEKLIRCAGVDYDFLDCVIFEVVGPSSYLH